ncbi:hypothetical protein [Lentibacillus sp. CBA3610]|uniref:hypothetical protein n=1 Tax=Lentibacillus sp. CBA3610 TaxID=2518176 RepID=UPI0015954150|nr:hypothetical protein [Lentibacillus sp. CBA3610]QKY70729.1 hypothetical protein Len3610_15020 [Lentibacillus sp. CBA3610]
MNDDEKIMELITGYEEKGKKEGEEEAKQEIAIEMFRKGYIFDVIMEITHLEREKVEELQSEFYRKELGVTISYEEKGRKLGEQKTRKEAAVEMLRKNISIERIVGLTHLERTEIEKLKNM